MLYSFLLSANQEVKLLEEMNLEELANYRKIVAIIEADG
jgi:hypothetical protein